MAGIARAKRETRLRRFPYQILQHRVHFPTNYVSPNGIGRK